MDRLTWQPPNYYGYFTPKDGIDGMYCVQLLAEYEDTGLTPAEIVSLKEKLDKALKGRLKELESAPCGDELETYTTGYRSGHRNGQIELIRYVLGMPDGSKEESENARYI